MGCKTLENAQLTEVDNVLDQRITDVNLKNDKKPTNKETSASKANMKLVITAH